MTATRRGSGSGRGHPAHPSEFAGPFSGRVAALQALRIGHQTSAFGAREGAGKEVSSPPRNPAKDAGRRHIRGGVGDRGWKESGADPGRRRPWPPSRGATVQPGGWSIEGRCLRGRSSRPAGRGGSREVRTSRRQVEIAQPTLRRDHRGEERTIMYVPPKLTPISRGQCRREAAVRPGARRRRPRCCQQSGVAEARRRVDSGVVGGVEGNADDQWFAAIRPGRKGPARSRKTSRQHSRVVGESEGHAWLRGLKVGRHPGPRRPARVTTSMTPRLLRGFGDGASGRGG